MLRGRAEVLIDGSEVWGESKDGSGFHAKGLAWVSDTKLTFCGEGPKAPWAKLQATYSKTTEDWSVTAIGTCTD